MSELLSISEAARRTGYSYSAMKKAVDSYRIPVADRTKEGYPRLEWKTVQEFAKDRIAKGLSTDTRKTAPESQTAHSIGGRADDSLASTGAAYHKSRAAREMFTAKIAQLELEQKQRGGEIQERKAIAQTEKLEAEAALARLALEKEARLLVDAETMEDLFSGMIADARDRILSIGASVRAAFPEAHMDIIKFIDRSAMEILSELGRIPDRQSIEIEQRMETEK